MKTLSATAVLSLLLLACAPHPEASNMAAGEAPAYEKVSMEGVTNTTRAGDLLFAGQPSPEALEALAAAGYQTVVNTRGIGEIDWNERKTVEDLGMTYLSIPMGKPVAITDDMVAAFDDAMKNAARPMLLHCGSGNRVASLYAVWLAERQGVAPEEALAQGVQAGITSMRPVVEKRLGLGGGE